MSKTDFVLHWIPTGHENAVTLARLAAITDLGERDLKDRIQQLRKAGHPVISMASGGYFLPDPNSPEDALIADRYVKMMYAQATERMATVKAVSAWLERNADKQTMIPWEV